MKVQLIVEVEVHADWALEHVIQSMMTYGSEQEYNWRGIDAVSGNYKIGVSK